LVNRCVDCASFTAVPKLKGMTKTQQTKYGYDVTMTFVKKKKINKLCGRPPEYTPTPLQVDL